MQLSDILHKKVQIQNQTKMWFFIHQFKIMAISESSELGSVERRQRMSDNSIYYDIVIYIGNIPYIIMEVILFPYLLGLT